MGRMIDADKLIERLVEIRDRPYQGNQCDRNNRKFNLNCHSRDRITLDIKQILRMVKENENTNNGKVRECLNCKKFFDCPLLKLKKKGVCILKK